MTSQLEALPLDVLHRCAIFAGSASTFEPPTSIARLSQTSSIMYKALDATVSPNVYGRVFASKFDTAALQRRSPSFYKDSSLAADLQARFRMLRRSRLTDLSPTGLMEDMWTALWMFLESDGLNETQLQKANFSAFILAVSKMLMNDQQSGATPAYVCSSVGPLVVWLLSFSLSSHTIRTLSNADWTHLYCFLYPYASPSAKVSQPEPCRQSSSHRSGCICPQSAMQGLDQGCRPGGDALKPPSYRTQYRDLPNPRLAAINLACGLQEKIQPKIPPHFPATRAIANANHVQGPTQEDYGAWVSYRTPQYTDSVPNQETEDDPILQSVTDKRSTLHDLEFRNMLQSIPLDSTHPELRHIPGRLAGVWEGTLMALPTPTTGDPPSYPFHKPNQCAFKEFIIPSDYLSSSTHAEILDNLAMSDFSLTHDALELSVRGHTYRRHVALERPRRDGEAADLFFNVMLSGETLETHDLAWGGFKFWGGVYEDGRIVLKRLGKENDGDQGVWIFEGRMRFGKVFLGTWRILNAGFNGVFSMGMTAAN